VIVHVFCKRCPAYRRAPFKENPTMSQPRVRRPSITELLQPADNQHYTGQRSLQAERVSVQAMGGTGLRFATHFLVRLQG